MTLGDLEAGVSLKKKWGTPKIRLRQRYLKNLGLHIRTLIHVRKIATADLWSSPAIQLLVFELCSRSWPVATYGCESWTLRKNEETCLDAFEMKGLRRILRVSWTAKKTYDGFLTKLEYRGNC